MVRKTEFPWGKFAAMVAIAGTIASIGVIAGRVLSLEARAEPHLAAVPTEAAQFAALAATVRVSCDRLERIERQVDDLHKLMIPARPAAGGTNVAHANGGTQ
jgi:hypothetical protein